MAAVQPSVQTLLEKPQFLLHRIDAASSQLVFLETTRELLSALPFIDGRVQLSPNRRSYSIRIQEALEWQANNERSSQADRFIFHVSFCGSTLLARACDVPGRSFAYKEPRALIDLATIKARRLGQYTDRELWSKLAKLTLGQLRKPWSAGEVSIVKMSNWANSTLIDLLQHGRQPRAVLLSIGLRDFLKAVLRGGPSRIDFTCRVLSHLQAENEELGQLIERSASLKADPMENVVRLAALARHAQIRIFDRALAMKSTGSVHCLSYEELVQHPAEAIKGVSQALNLNLSEQDIGAALNKAMARDAKHPERFFDRQRAHQISKRVEKEYGQLIDRVIDWYQFCLGH